MPDMEINDLRPVGGVTGDPMGTGGPPPRRRAPPPVIAVAVPTPPARRRAPPAEPAIETTDPWVAEAEAVENPLRLVGKGQLAGFHRPLPIYWQLHGAPDYVKRQIQDLADIRRYFETDDTAALEKMTCQTIVNCFMYEDGLRRFYSKPQLTDDQFAKLTTEMTNALPNTHTGCHTDIINIDGDDVIMRWHTGSGEIIRDNINAAIFYKLVP